MTFTITEMRGFLSKDYITTGSDSIVSIDEVDPGGAGTVRMTITGNYVVVRPKSGTHQIIWLSDHKCADGCVVTFKNQTTVCIHLVELKSKVKPKEWEKVKSQFNGMLLNTLALIRLGGEQINVEKVDCYLAYTGDGMAAAISANPVLQKKMPGLSLPPNCQDWNSKIIELPLGMKGNFFRHLRDHAGNLDLGSI